MLIFNSSKATEYYPQKNCFEWLFHKQLSINFYLFSIEYLSLAGKDFFFFQYQMEWEFGKMEQSRKESIRGFIQSLRS